MKPNRINSFAGLRAVAMLTVFCCHLDYLSETSFQGFYSLINNGRFGVNFFLVLSGFVIAFGYSKRLNGNRVLQDISFVKKRISKIYIPYLLAMILAIPLHIHQVSLEGGLLDAKSVIIRLIINIGMIQSVIPFAKYSASINRISWFVSTIFIIYLFTPGVIRLNNKATKINTFAKLVISAFSVFVLYCCVYMAIREIEYVRYADHGLSIIYTSPLIRIFPFLLGIIGYNMYCLLDGMRIRYGSVIEILGMAVFFIWWIIADKTGLPTIITECTDMLVSVLVVLVFAVSTRGIVSGLLSNERMLALGKISLEFYLIHYLVINYGMIAVKHFGLDKGIAVLPCTILFLVISLYGAFLVHSFSEWLLLTFRKKKQSA